MEGGFAVLAWCDCSSSGMFPALFVARNGRGRAMLSHSSHERIAQQAGPQEPPLVIPAHVRRTPRAIKALRAWRRLALRVFFARRARALGSVLNIWHVTGALGDAAAPEGRRRNGYQYVGELMRAAFEATAEAPASAPVAPQDSQQALVPYSGPTQAFSPTLDSSQYEPAPLCRMCGHVMVLYEWTDPLFGEHFWGCSTYPRCRAMQQALPRTTPFVPAGAGPLPIVGEDPAAAAADGVGDEQSSHAAHDQQAEHLHTCGPAATSCAEVDLGGIRQEGAAIF